MKGFGLILIFLAVQSASAQPSPPHIGYVYPAGGCVGTTFEVAVGGQRLSGVHAARVSGDGVNAKMIEHIIPLTPVQATVLRDLLKELVEHKVIATTRPATTRPWTGVEERKLADIRAKLAAYQPRPASPAIAEIVRLQVTIAPNAEPGRRELRLQTQNGLTNPMVFEIGRFQEFTKPRAMPVTTTTMTTAKPGEMRVTLPSVINGQIMPGQVDRFRFAASKGDHLVAIVQARALIPYLADAVPGWFQATLSLQDAAGKELAYEDDYRFQPDPILHYLIPADGEYVIAVKDSIYRGREDFVYRIAIGALPFVTSLFPLGGQAGERTAVELKGWNLPSYHAVMDATTLASGVHPLHVTKRPGVCNSPPFAIDTLPEAPERETNDSTASAQAVTTPVIINGRIDRPGDRDVFEFEAAAGETIVAEVTARRLGSPLDSVVRLTNAQGKQVEFNDDHEDKGDGLGTHHADSLLSATLPAAGHYFIQIEDVQHKGGIEFAYRLRISSPRPDFALRVVPSSINPRPGGDVPISVFVLRKDGFSGDIDVTLKDAPPGVKLSPGRISQKQEQVRLSLSAPSGPANHPVNLYVQGNAIINGQTIIRDAIPADDMMQAFIYRHLVCADELLLTISQRQPTTRRSP